MQITRAGEYAVLGLINLARRQPALPVMIDDISRTEKIPRSFLAKIFQNLVKAGLVRSVRGAGGGFALAKEPSQISVLEVIEAVEGKIIFQRCKQQIEPECIHVGGCVLCGLFERAQDGMKAVFMNTTLQDLLRKQEKIDSARDEVNQLKATLHR